MQGWLLSSFLCQLSVSSSACWLKWPLTPPPTHCLPGSLQMQSLYSSAGLFADHVPLPLGSVLCEGKNLGHLVRQVFLADSTVPVTCEDDGQMGGWMDRWMDGLRSKFLSFFNSVFCPQVELRKIPQVRPFMTPCFPLDPPSLTHTPSPSHGHISFFTHLGLRHLQTLSQAPSALPLSAEGFFCPA